MYKPETMESPDGMAEQKNKTLEEQRGMLYFP